MKKLLVLLFLLFVGSFALANEHEIYKLENGQTVIIQEVKTNPIVTIDTWIKTGSINEDDKNNGVSHFLEHLFFKGTKEHPPGDFDKILENKGAVTNAATSKDFTHYYITIPSKDFATALELHADMLLNPLVPRKELEMERKVVLEEIAKDQNSPGSLVYDNLVSMLYTTHPYKRKVIGTSDIISNITREEIMNYYHNYYNPSNMVTIIVGDVDKARALELVKKDFCCSAKKPIKNIYPKEQFLTSQKRMVAKFPCQCAYMLIGFRGVKVSDPDIFALDVLATILGDGRSSVLNQTIKEQKQLAFDIDASDGGAKDDGIFYISSNFEPGNYEKLEAAIFEEITKIQTQGVTPAQLSLAKNIIERDTYYSRESITNIATEIGYTMVTADDIKMYENYIANVKKVTAADVKRVANKYLGKEKSAVSIVLPEDFETEKKINHSTVQPSNRSTLIVTPNATNDIIAITIYSKGGQLTEKIPGTAGMVASVMTKGTKKYSSVELAQLLEDNGIKVSPAINVDTFKLSVLTTKNEYAKTLDILNELINNATFPETEIEKVRNEKLNGIKASRDKPFNIAIEEYKGLIYGNSAYSTSPKVWEKTLPTIKREDIVAYYKTIFDPQNLVISINGNVDEKTAQQDFNKILANNHSTTQAFNYSTFEVPALTASKTVTREIKDLKTDWILIGWQAPGLLSKKDYATLEVIDAILGSGMSSRLFVNLRVKDGLAYQLGSQYAANVLRGAFIVFIGTNPENLDKAKSKLFEEVYRFKTEFVGTKELQDAKEKLIGQYILSQETNSEKAATLGWFEASGRGKDFGKEYEKLINAVTITDITEAANKYFNDKYILSVVKDK